MIDALRADRPDPELGDSLATFGQFVGSWEVQVTTFDPDGSSRSASGEWSFGWALGGRAIVDVWNVPGREHGMAVRFFDPTIGVWRVSWSGPVTGRQIIFTAREQGEEIVLEGEEDGLPVKWIFSQIEDDSFRWHAVCSRDGGESWQIMQEMRLTRSA
jgi:hypothetical protein